MFLIVLLLWTAGVAYGAFEIARKFFAINLLSADKLNDWVWVAPVWLLGVIFFGILFKKKKSKKIIQQAVADHPFVPVKGFVPHAMPSQGKSMSFSPQITNAPAQNTASVPPAPTVSTPFTAPNTAQNNLESQAVQEITRLAEAKGLTAFPHVLLENVMLPLTVSSDVKALLFKFVSSSGVWHVDEKEDLAESLWTNQGRSLLLTKELLQAKKTLLQMEPSAEAIPVVMLLDGSLENEVQVQDYLRKFDAEIVCLNRKENSQLMTISELLDKVFTEPVSSQEGEEHNES